MKVVINLRQWKSSLQIQFYLNQQQRQRQQQQNQQQRSLFLTKSWNLFATTANKTSFSLPKLGSLSQSIVRNIVRWQVRRRKSNHYRAWRYFLAKVDGSLLAKVVKLPNLNWKLTWSKLPAPLRASSLYRTPRKSPSNFLATARTPCWWMKWFLTFEQGSLRVRIINVCVPRTVEIALETDPALLPLPLPRFL